MFILAVVPYKNQKPRSFDRGFSGAATQIRTGDLILTKDVLYQLSHSSISQEYFLVTQTIIPKYIRFVNTFVKKCLRKNNLFFKIGGILSSIIQK